MSDQWEYDAEEEPNEALQHAAETARELIHRKTEAEYAEAFEDTDEDEDEEDDDDTSNRPRVDALEIMTPTEFNAHRLEAWEMAYVALFKDHGNDRHWGDYTVDAADVLILARFLEGDDIGE